MPENFASLLEALNDEGRALAKPAPAAVIETLGRSRRRKHRFTAAGSAVAVCALAAGVALSTGGAARRPSPTSPVPTPVSAPTSVSGSHQAVTTANRTGLAALLQPSELPQPALFQWNPGLTRTDSRPEGAVAPACGYGVSSRSFPDLHPQGQVVANYISASNESNSVETILHYSSAAAARADYDVLKPDPAHCSNLRVTGTVTDGYAWLDSVAGTSSMHKMVFLSGSDVAFWFYAYQDDTKPYDTSDDQAALQRMADRLDGRAVVPDPVTAPPAGTLPASAWLDPSQIPFATADRSHGWVPLGGQQAASAGKISGNLCESVTSGDDFVAQEGATILTRSYHGSPSTTPVYQGSNYLYSSADEHIVSFPGGAVQAQMGFAWSKQILQAHGCQFEDGSGAQTTRRIKIGTVTGTGFSLLATDTPGTTSYEHLYCVIKGSHVAWMMINFEQGDTSTGGDATILTAMAARLP